MSAWRGIDGPLKVPVRLAVGTLAMVCTAPVFGHAVEQAPADAGLRSAWSFEPWVLACLAASAVLYAVGLARLWSRAGRGHGVGVGQASAFAVGWSTLVVALVMPLDAQGSLLFSAHMVQHELLMLVAAPLLVLGRPLALWAWGLPQPWCRAAGRLFHHPAWRVPWLIVTGPLAAWLVHALALWLWHVPALFEAALNDSSVHSWQHLGFLFSALLFWWSVLGAVTREEQGAALVSLFTTMVHTGALGALLTLARTPWYPHYLGTTVPFGITALEDQQLGGLIMWLPASAVYIVCGLALAARWMVPLAKPRRPARVGVR
jgi:putative membrane protein